MFPLVSARAQVAYALAGLVALAVVGAMILPSGEMSVNFHQAPTSGPLSLTVTGSPPSSVVASANYPASLRSGPVNFGGELLRVSATPGLGGSVQLTANPPGRAPVSQQVNGGLLAVATDPAAGTTTLTITCAAPCTGMPAEAARIVVNPSAQTTDLRLNTGRGAPVRVLFAPLWSVTYDDAGNAVHLAFQNPVSILTSASGVPGPKPASPALLDATWTSNNLHLSMPAATALGLGSRDISTTAAQGDPLAADGWSLQAGAKQVTLRLRHDRGAVWATAEGNALGLAGPVGVGVPDYGLAPWSSLLLVWEGNQLSPSQAQYLNPATLAPVFEAKSTQGGSALTVPQMHRAFVVPGALAAVDAAGHGLGITVTQDGSSSPALDATFHTTSVPPLLEVNTALSDHGQISSDVLLGTVLTQWTDAQGRAGAALADLQGNPLLTAEPTSQGLHVRAGRNDVSVANARVQTAGPSTLTVVDGNGAPVASATVLGFAPDATTLARLTVQGQESTLASPVELVGPEGAPCAARVFSPVNPQITILQITACGTPGAWVNGIGNATNPAPQVPPTPPNPPTIPTQPPTPGSPLQVTGNPASDNVVRLGGTANGKAIGLQIDRSAAPAQATLTAGDETYTTSAPFVVQGNPTDPSRIVVLHPASGETLLSLKDNEDGTSTLLLQGKEPQTVQTTRVRSEGLPLASPTWRVTLLDNEGAVLQSASVNRAEILAKMCCSGQELVDAQLVQTGTALGGAVAQAQDATSVNFYKVASDGPRILGPRDLDGRAWLNGNREISVRVDVPKDKDVYAPRVLYASGARDLASSPGAALQRGDPVGDFVPYRGAIPAAWLSAQGDGATIRFALAYDLLGKPAQQRLLDDNEGRGYAFRADLAAPAGATVTATPDAARPLVLKISWHAADAGSGIRSYDVEKSARATAGQPVWEPWIQGAHEASADFTGAPGGHYNFRARGIDQVGHVGEWSNATRADLPPLPAAPAGSNATQPPPEYTNHAPTIRLLAPAGGEQFVKVGTIEVRWQAADPDGTIPVVTLSMSRDGGASWEIVDSPSGASYAWDVRFLPAGDWRLKASANDGSLQDADTSGTFHVDNSGLLTVNSIGGPDGQQKLPGDLKKDVPGSDGDQQKEQGAASVDLGVVVGIGAVLVIAAGAVAVFQWRARR